MNAQAQAVEDSKIMKQIGIVVACLVGVAFGLIAAVMIIT